MNLSKTLLLSIFTFMLMLGKVMGDPPEPQEGYRWVLQPSYSDEFNGNSLDNSKWHDYFIGWKGRSPAKFDPSTISLSGGNMVIRNKKLSQPDGQYTIGGGAVQSNGVDAFFGYYECNFKASRINMSTTFWMSNGKVSIQGPTKLTGDCEKDKYSQELDICESIGGAGNFSSKFRTQMNFNTHYRYVDCNSAPEKFYSAGNNAVEGNGQSADASLVGGTESWEAFHTYACYWRDSKTVDFYVDNKFAGSVNVRRDVVDDPFDRPMKINMVTETYNWAKPYPTDAQLANSNINASFYDWIRSYKLVPIDEVVNDNYNPAIYQENVSFVDFITNRASLSSYSFPMTYKANVDRDIHIIIKDSNGQEVSDTKFTALEGYGKKSFTVNLSNALAQGIYTVTAEIRPVNGGQGSAISTTTENLTIGEGQGDVDVIHFNNTPNQFVQGTTLEIPIIYTASETRDIVALLNAPDGTWLGNAVQTVSAGSGSQTLTIQLANVPAIDSDYKLSVLIRTAGGSWADNIDLKDKLVDIIEEFSCPTVDLYNECFEGNGFDAWGGWGSAIREVSGVAAHSGLYGLRVKGQGAPEFTINGLSPNTEYELTGYVKIISEQVNLGVKNFSDAGEMSSVNTNTSFEKKTVTFTTGPNNTSALVYFYSPSANGEGYLDDLTLRPTLVTYTQEHQKSDWSVYPNPTTRAVHLSKDIPWELYSSKGLFIKSGLGQDIDLSELSPGSYLLKSGTHFEHLIKQ